jgi:RNA polymerase sigma factor (sigma-70 family)
MDLFQSGSMGLTWAISSFNYRSGESFPNFAKRWIRQRVQGSMKASSGPEIRLPFSVWEEYARIRRAAEQLQQEDPYSEVTSEDIGQLLDTDPRTIEQTLTKIRMVYTVSLEDEVPGSDEAPVTREATIPDESIENGRELADKQELLFAALQHLSPRERRLICLRYGFLDGIENNKLNPNEKLRELFRQLSCKTLLHRKAITQDN